MTEMDCLERETDQRISFRKFETIIRPLLTTNELIEELSIT